MRVDRSRAAWSAAVALFLMGSALAMLGGDNAGSATPEMTTNATTNPSTAPETKTDDKIQVEVKADGKTTVQVQSATGYRDASGVACLSDPTVLEDIKKRREELDLRNRELAVREAELKARETALNEELKKLAAVRDEISKLDTLNSKQSEEKVGKLVETIETMSPKAAAGMLAGMDETLAITAMSRMGTQKLAKVLNLIEPGRASRLSEGLAGVARARKNSASEGATAATNQSVKGGDKNDGHNENNASGSTENSVER